MDIIGYFRQIWTTHSLVIPGSNRPVSVTITGHLNTDARLLAFADAYQRQLDLGSERPELEFWLEKFKRGKMEKDALQKRPADKEAEEKDIE